MAKSFLHAALVFAAVIVGMQPAAAVVAGTQQPAVAPGMQQAAAAESHGLQCPATAPPAWGLVPSPPLSGVEVLSAPTGTEIDNDAPPSLMPDTQDNYNRTLHQSWQMNNDGPGWSFFVDCHYAGTQRVLRLDAAGVTRCDYSVSPYSMSNGPDVPAHHQLVCR